MCLVVEVFVIDFVDVFGVGRMGCELVIVGDDF